MTEPSDLTDAVLAYSTDVFQTCRRYTGSTEAAWDAYQETFLALARRQHDLECHHDLRPWLRETARRCSLSVRRETVRIMTSRLAPNDLADHAAAEVGNLSSALEALVQEVSELPEEDRELLELIYKRGLTHREAATEWNCAVGSIDARLSQLRQRLQRRLKRRRILAGMLLLLFMLSDSAEAAERSPFPAGVWLDRVIRAGKRVVRPLAVATVVLIISTTGILVTSKWFAEGSQLVTNPEEVSRSATNDVPSAPGVGTASRSSSGS